jgi:hypothetical protein
MSVSSPRHSDGLTLSSDAQQRGFYLLRLPTEFVWLIEQIRPLLHWHLASFLAIAAGSLLALISPLLLKWLIDSIIPQKSMGLLLFAVALIFIGYEGRVALTSLGSYLMLSASLKMALTLRVSLLKHLDTLSADYYEGTAVGAAMYPLRADRGDRIFRIRSSPCHSADVTFIYVGRDGDLIKLSYRPNPSFQPPLREARVFHEMEGEMWVHETQRRLVRIRGHLIADVKFAGGLLGHLEKGGHFSVEQRELLPGQWDLTFMEVDMKGKALFFKTIAVKEKEYRSDFRTVADGLTLAEAADMLTKQVVVAANR